MSFGDWIARARTCVFLRDRLVMLAAAVWVVSRATWSMPP